MIQVGSKLSSGLVFIQDCQDLNLMNRYICEILTCYGESRGGIVIAALYNFGY